MNFAAASESKFIHGMPDGTFGPDQALTYGQAVTILLRLLGYTDADAGAIWPDGYLALAEANGVSEGLHYGANDTVDRAGAAKLFVNTLNAYTNTGLRFLETLGSLSEETVLLRVESGRMVTEDRSSGYLMAWPVEGSYYIGALGRVLIDSAGRALTFLPSTQAGSASPLLDAAVILGRDATSAGFDALTGGATADVIYRNGVQVPLSKLKRYDVVSYSPLDNALYACDLRVQVYYEDCEPSAKPKVIEALGGTRFEVLETAWPSLSQFKPGDTMVLMFTSDGRVAGAVKRGVEPAQNATAFVDAEGKASLLCGLSLLPLKLEGAETWEFAGQLVSLSQSEATEDDVGNGESAYFLTARTGGVKGQFNADTRKLDKYELNANALVFAEGQRRLLSELSGVYPAEQVQYVAFGDDNSVTVLQLRYASQLNVLYGRASVRREPVEVEDGVFYEQLVLDLESKGELLATGEVNSNVRDGDFVRATYRNGSYQKIERLSEVKHVTAANWIGETAVMVGNQTLRVSADVPCYNRDNGRWMRSLSAARAYGDSVDLYYDEGVVRFVVVGG